MIHSIEKPKGTYYTDFTFDKGYLYGIFEHDSRVSYKRMARTDITNDTWIKRDPTGKIAGFNGEVKETDTHLIIEIFEPVN